MARIDSAGVQIDGFLPSLFCDSRDRAGSVDDMILNHPAIATKEAINIIDTWAVTDVTTWLNCVGLSEYCSNFAKHRIGGLELQMVKTMILWDSRLSLSIHFVFQVVRNPRDLEVLITKMADRYRLQQEVDNILAGKTAAAITQGKEATEMTLYRNFMAKYQARQLHIIMTEDSFTHFAHHMVWVTQLAFTLASLTLLGLWVFYEKVEAFVGTFMVVTIAASAYYVKAHHLGEITVDGKHVPIVRYVDWITTTPIMLYELCHIAHVDNQTTFMIVGTDLLMLFFGIASALVAHHHFQVKLNFFVASCVFYLIMVLTLHVDVAHGLALKATSHVQVLFQRLESLTISVWSLYPFVVLVGRAHAGLISKNCEDSILCVLDMTAKIGLEGLIVAHAIMHHDPDSYSSTYSSYSYQG